MTDRRIAIALFVLAFVPYCYFYGGWGANQEVNFALTRAIVEARTFQVDDFTAHEGDIAAGAGGHIYSNKPPGLSILGAVPYKIQRAVERRAHITFRDYWRTNRMFTTIAICGACGALIAPVLYLYGRRMLGVRRWNAALAAIAIAFGTLVLPYSTMFFAHVPSALFLLLALTLLRSRPFWGGLAAGISTSCFFLSAPAALVLVVLAWRYAPRKAAIFVAGGVPIAIALAIDQWICFGSPFILPLQRSSSYTNQGLLFGVFGRIDWAHVWAILVPEYRGLLFCSPILLLALYGGALMFRRFRAELIAIAAIAVIFILVIGSFNGWHGGAAFGPRYLVTIIPLLGIPMMFAADRARWAWLAIGVVSFAINLAATAVDPMPEPEVVKPLTGYIAPSIAHGRVALVYDSGNLGESLFGKGRAVSVIPAVIWIAAGSAWILATAARGDRIAAA
jgi:hypothetical protein